MVVLQNPNNGDEPDRIIFSYGEPETPRLSDELESTCSTPYVSAPSSPGRSPTATSGYFFSAPASPMHYVLYSAPSATRSPSEPVCLSSQSDMTSFEFEFSSRFPTSGSVALGPMSSADELFLNGLIRPMKLSSHLERPQTLAPLVDLVVEEDDAENNDEGFNNREERVIRGRDLKLRSRSLRRKARSLSPLRNPEFEWSGEDCKGDQREDNEHVLELHDIEGKQNEMVSAETTPSCSASSSRSSSSGRNSKKWIFLKDLLYRSKSEGSTRRKERFWSSISFSSPKVKKIASHPLNLSREDKTSPSAPSTVETQKQKDKEKGKQKRKEQVSGKKPVTGKPENGVAKRRIPLSAHELHYAANRAQAEEMKKKTYLPYRQGLFGCLGLSSKGYGALNGLARTMNPVSSR